MDNKKLKKLEYILKSYKKAVIAFSGGVDSSFLSKVAINTLGKENVLLVTADSPTYQKAELEAAKNFAKNLKANHLVINTDELSNKNFIENPSNRCFYCKDELFGKLKEIAKEYKIPYVLDASNADDLKDYRPGSKAKEIHKVRSPLQEVGLTKKEIRVLSKQIGLTTFDKPALACLASRISYFEPITEDKLKAVEEAEEILHRLGFRQCRVRNHNMLCRIELEKEDINKVVNPDTYAIIVRHFKRLGFKYITIDLEGYRTGSMNLEINDLAA